MRLLVLYEELATYFIKCITTLAENHSAEIYIIHKEVNKEAPFDLHLNSKITSYNRSHYSDEELISLVKKINPDGIFCGGWSSKVYLKIAQQYKGKIPIVVGFDNKWTGSLRQRVASIFGGFYIANKFDKCFVPGPEQKIFALKMGFKGNQIALGAYSCDFDFFHNQYLANKAEKEKSFPKRFIYVGRYYEFKGIKNLWSAFTELQKEFPNDWELWCLGNGDIEPINHPQIKHFGFVQPSDLNSYIKSTGVFVLPSFFEPWGVVVHEYASAGFPIICSDKVGARTAFVENNYNGYIYKSDSITELKDAMKRIILADNAALNVMGERSVEKAKNITPEKWVQQLMKLIK